MKGIRFSFGQKLPKFTKFFEKLGKSQNIPIIVDSEFKMWNLYFPNELLDKWVDGTNLWFKKRCIKCSRSNNLNIYLKFLGKTENSRDYVITRQDLLNYWGIEFATAIIDYKVLRWYWRTEETFSGLLGNEFFKRTMSCLKFFY